jgi:type II secretory pathway component PulC
MADLPKRAGLGRPAVIAIGFAVVALVTSLIAVFVVMRRSSSEPAVVVAPQSARIDRTIDANEVTKLKRDVVEKAVDGSGDVIGVKVKDDAVRTALGLEPDDVITAINGRAIKREFDVYDAVLGMSMMDASIVYVEIVRDKQPALVRWKLDGDLRQARNGPMRRPPTTTTNPFTAPPDPIVDSIRRIDALHYEVPRSTIDQLLAHPDQYARQARIVPSVRYGQPDGFKLYAISTGSLWFAIGLANGDTIRSVNGHDLSTPDKALELYTKLKDATELRILVGRRGGIEETIVITIK